VPNVRSHNKLGVVENLATGASTYVTITAVLSARFAVRLGSYNIARFTEMENRRGAGGESIECSGRFDRGRAIFVIIAFGREISKLA